MTSTLNSLASVIANGLLFSLLSVLAERLLIISGLTRGNKIGVVIVAFTLAILKQLLNYDAPLYIYGLVIIIVGPLSVNRADLTVTLRQGRWWWKTENRDDS